MECLKSARAISEYLDCTESEQVLREHVVDCGTCSDAVNDLRRLRQNVRNLPARQPSEHLQTALRVIASRERARRVARMHFTNAFSAWCHRARVVMKNLMQPLALPVAGGLAAAILLFGTLLPDFAAAHPIGNDVPTVLFTSASVKDAFWPVIGETDIVVDLTIDESGRMTNYSVVSGSPLLQDESTRRRFESALLLTQFTPATAFGQPTAGKVRVSFRTSRIDIKG